MTEELKEEKLVKIDKRILRVLKPYITNEEISNLCNQTLLEKALKITEANTFSKLYKLEKAINERGRHFLWMTGYPKNSSSFVHFKDFILTTEYKELILEEYPAVDWFVGFSQPWDNLHERIYKCCKKTLVFDPERETEEFIIFMDNLLKIIYSDGKQRTPCDNIKNIHPANCVWLDPDPKHPGSYYRTNVTCFPICKNCENDCVVSDKIKSELLKIKRYINNRK